MVESDHQAKHKFPTADEEDLTKKVRADEESTTTFLSSSSSSNSHRVGAGSTVTGGERGEKRAAQDPPADCGQEDPSVEDEDLERGNDTAMDCLSFQE